ncbi:TolC family protein [Desulforamulus ferrireducens]|uniref:Outer membrane efflux protein n=1 Tax=Desulforamulus ferrireducens TaxID=1833852 RepID=A0A1S6J018_9FIRM|nr:TolC family protein [Desulforamulus ferrireducens]AQS60365.1 hypothetical protein B0537_15605 [Desulforamulus ferrireducens]
MKKLLTLLLSLMIVFACSLSAYGEENNVELSLEQAINKALDHSVLLKNDKSEIEKMDILFNDVSSMLRYTPVDLSFNPSDTNLFKAFYSTEFEKKKAEKKYDNDRKQVVIDVKDKYYSVIASQKKLAAAQVAWEKSKIKLLQTQARYKVGLATNANLAEEEANEAAAKTAVMDAQAKLDNAYGELNRLLGEPITSKPKLIDMPVVEKKELDVNEQVNMAVGNSFEMWTVEESVNLTSRLRLFERFYDVGDYNYDQALNSLSDSKQELRNKTQALCLNINYLYEKYNELQQRKLQYEATLKQTKAMFAVGMTTKDNVLQVEYALKETEAGQIEVASAYVTALDTLARLTGKELGDV